MALRRGLQRLCNPLVREFQSSCSANAASESVALSGTAPAFPAWLGAQGARRVSAPLTQPLPGIKDEASLLRPLAPPPTEQTTLSNGVRVVSEASPGPVSSLGIYINSGSIHETPATSGASALLECLAYKATKNRDTQRIMKEIEVMGANITANASREQMSYTIDFLKYNLAPALELLCDTVVNPALLQEDIDEQKARLTGVLASPEVQLTLMTEELLRAVYKGPLGNRLIPDPAQIQHLTPDVLARFVQQQYVAPQIVLAGAGVDHRTLVELAQPMLGALPAAQPPAVEPSQYVGGAVHIPGDHPEANLVLAYEYAGGWMDIPGSVIMTVLTYLLGGGNSFSSGGPGKGMHSRLYTRVLNRHHWCSSCSAFSHTFNTSGLMGIQAACEPKQAQNMLKVMCGELESLTDPVPRDALERAKHMSISLIHNALESKSASAEDMGRQFLTYGHRVSGRDYVAMVQAITPRQVAEFAQRLLQSKPSLALFGDGADKVDDSIVQRQLGASVNDVPYGSASKGGGRSVLGRWSNVFNPLGVDR